MKVIHVLGHEQKFAACSANLAIAWWAGFGCALTNALPSLAIPIPNQIWIVCERFRRCQFRRIKISPITILAPKRRDSALRRDSRAGDNENAHSGRINNGIISSTGEKDGFGPG